jgi:small subunit ribosomal protein S3
MDSGAIGIEIIVSGKMSGSKAQQTKVIEGYLKQSGEPSRTLVDYGFEVAQTKPGTIGVKVMIMKEFQDITGEIRKTVKPTPAPEKAELITETLAKGEGEEDDELTEKPKSKKPAAAKKKPKAAKKPVGGKKEPAKEEAEAAD